ncbi:MAG TPA: LytTR family DNA-binding domain-containing protein [Flavilitoribacter sp.]|nr:LytTR family DNA-binding domain-containing protein [Flavilitoribacter sp.]
MKPSAHPTLRAIALDDEPIALEMLAEYAARMPDLQLEQTFTDPFLAMSHLKQTPVELLFLDIQMPDLTGFQFLQTLQSRPPALIFTTAYSQYGAEGFNVDAVDYLLKPYDFQRFARAVNKAGEWLAGRNVQPLQEQPTYIFVKSEHQLVKVTLDKIRWLEAWGDYVKIFTDAEKPLLTLTSLSIFAEVLPEKTFARVHRSYIVSIPHITVIQRNRIYIGEKNIPVGESFSEGFYDRLLDV